MNAARMAVALAEQGVVWRKKDGAACPVCGVRMRVQTKRGQVRYCRCQSIRCMVRELRLSVKAVPEKEGSPAGRA